MTRYSLASLARRAAGGHRGWPNAWRRAAPKAAYDAIVIGGGGHGLATAYYLAKEHAMTDVAVLEKGWIGGGNTGRNAAIIRSNYLRPESAALYDHALDLWPGLGRELNFNVMFSPRGVLGLANSPAEESVLKRHIQANRLAGVDAEWLTPRQAKAICPPLDISPDARFPVRGAALQRRGGVARHDAVAWGYARAADRMGVDIVENCEVVAIRRDAGRVTGVDATRGAIAAPRVAMVGAGHCGVLAAMAGLRLPVQSFPLQALASEPLKPVIACVVMGGAINAYVSQSDRGELVVGAASDSYVSYTQRGGLHIVEEALTAILALFPTLARVRMMRQWGGVVDVTPDRSPIIDRTPVRGLYVNCGWGTGGFKATPGSGRVFAHLVARDAPHRLSAAFALERFSTGRLIDEAAAAAVTH